MEKDNNNNGNGNLAESEHKKTEAAAAAATLTAETASTTTSRDEAKRAREWFATLSTEDQVVALGFAADQDFLATLSRSAATFLSFPSVSGRENPTMDGLYSKVSADLMMGTVSPDSLEKVAAAGNSSLTESEKQKEPETQSTVPMVSDDEATVEDVEASEEMASKGESNNSMNGETNVSDAALATGEQEPIATQTGGQHSDAFRIRESSNETEADGTIPLTSQGQQKDNEAGDETPANVSPPRNDDATLVSDGNISAENEKKDQISAFIKSVITISPSAFQLVGSDVGPANVLPPILSLHPSYLSQESGQETLAAFDDIMSSGKFLSDPVYKSVNDAVQSSASGTVPSSPSTPLYMLLLLRFQLSVLESHRNSLNATDATPETSPHAPPPPTSAIEKEGGKETATTGSELEFTNPTPTLVDETTKSGGVDVEVSQSSPADSDATQQQQQDVEKVVEIEAEAEINNVSVGPDQLIALLPPLFKRIVAAEEEGKDTEKIILDLAAFLEVSSKGDNLNETLKAIDEDVARRIRALQENPVVGSESSNGALSGIGASDEGNNPAKEESSKVTDEVGGNETPTEVDGSSETSDSALDAGGKKNAKKKKRRKKRKGGGGPALAASPEIEDENDDENEAVVETPPPILETVDESTQTDVVSTEIIDIPIPEESEIAPSVSILISDKALDDTVHSDKSIGDETTDTLEASTQTQNNNEKSSGNAVEAEEGLPIATVDRVGTVVATLPPANESSASDPPVQSAPVAGVQSSASPEDDHDEWETVEVRSRGNRKKPGDRASNGRFSSLQSHHGHGSRKKNPRTSESRKRVQKRKMVRDILYSVLDSVDEQVRRRKQQASDPSPRPVPNAWGTLPAKVTSPTTGKASELTNTQSPASQRKDGATMRDILMGKQSASAAQVSSPQQVSQRGYADRVRQRASGEAGKKTRDKPSLVSPTADQNTAPTVPETLSAVSTASAFTETPSAKNIPQAPGLGTSESSSSESVGATKPQSNSKQPNKEATPSPPLPTLLSPGNANSATSSVASSLDAPHVVHHNHHSSFLGSESDVGYHLLRVCDRLTRDIAQFMKRRDQALKIRRHERGLVLGALQDSLSAIWPSGCKVEMYGSCATDLDLPSSDLDVVVCGLDESEQAAIHAESPSSPGSRSESECDTTANGTDDSEPIPSAEKAKQQSPLQSGIPQSQYAMVYQRMTTNAERVVTLAMELERQPWAVHVKAIPTATVPVIKILADPARLQGTSTGNGDWLVQQPQGQSTTLSPPSTGDAPDQMSPYPGSQNQMPWRGADVVNGLLKVDITFEGPEHGGIGSTRFSSRVVEEFSNESGVPADGTAEVQVLMVLKELLAQRRLNEPFSGGLSSYALLLLMISVVRERAIIRKELERVERQRKLVAAGGGNAVPRSGPTDATEVHTGSTSTSKEAKPTTDAKKQNKGSQKNDKTKSKSSKQNGEKQSGKGTTTASARNEGGRGKGNKSHTNPKPGEQTPSNGSNGQDDTLNRGPASSSWASVARKSSASLSKKESQDSIQGTTPPESKAPPVKKMSSFAEAVAKGSATSQSNNDSTKVRAKKADPKPKGADSKKGKDQDGTANTKSDAQAKSNSGKKIISSLPVDAPSFEPMNVQSLNAASPTKQTASSLAEESGSFFPQSFHDVIEVLCSGETTPGKLLMHFLLFYGQHFDSHSTAIDYSNTHERDANANNGYAVSSPYLQRRNTGSYDPMTGMLTIDPIVVYDPLEGAEANNVARSCFAWSSIRWVFAQSYMTLSSAVEMSAGHQPGKGNSRSAPPPQSTSNGQNEVYPAGEQDGAWVVPYGHDESGNVIFDPSTPLLELLLSF